MYWLATGSDPESDSGAWTVIVKAQNEECARTSVEIHLMLQGRSDLEIATLAQIRQDNPLYSNVESR